MECHLSRNINIKEVHLAVEGDDASLLVEDRRGIVELPVLCVALRDGSAHEDDAELSRELAHEADALAGAGLGVDVARRAAQAVDAPPLEELRVDALAGRLGVHLGEAPAGVGRVAAAASRAPAPATTIVVVLVIAADAAHARAAPPVNGPLDALPQPAKVLGVVVEVGDAVRRVPALGEDHDVGAAVLAGGAADGVARVGEVEGLVVGRLAQLDEGEARGLEAEDGRGGGRGGHGGRRGSGARGGGCGGGRGGCRCGHGAEERRGGKSG